MQEIEKVVGVKTFYSLLDLTQTLAAFSAAPNT